MARPLPPFPPNSHRISFCLKQVFFSPLWPGLYPPSLLMAWPLLEVLFLRLPLYSKLLYNGRDFFGHLVRFFKRGLGLSVGHRKIVDPLNHFETPRGPPKSNHSGSHNLHMPDFFPIV